MVTFWGIVNMGKEIVGLVKKKKNLVKKWDYVYKNPNYHYIRYMHVPLFDKNIIFFDSIRLFIYQDSSNILGLDVHVNIKWTLEL